MLLLAISSLMSLPRVSGICWHWILFIWEVNFCNWLQKQRGLESGKFTKGMPAKDEDDIVDEEEDEEHGETLCGVCGENYAADEFWICCDICEKWFHGKCVKITPARAEHITQYKCPSCSNKRAHPWYFRRWINSYPFVILSCWS